jgi:exopolysaccharide biosynthesis predicted pyruvyltransferase EpsI
MPKIAEIAKKKKSKLRCCRCGHENIGSNHKPNAAINSIEYFNVPDSNRMIQWAVPIRFEVGDTRKRKAHTSIKNTWKRKKKELNLSLHEEDFPAW